MLKISRNTLDLWLKRRGALVECTEELDAAVLGCIRELS